MKIIRRIIIVNILISIMFLVFSTSQYVNVVHASQTKLEEGIYIIKTALNENYVFDIQGGSLKNGGNLQLENNSQKECQKFKIEYLNNGTYSISAEHSEKYLDVQGSSKENGTNIAQWQYHGLENQQWIIQDKGNGYYNIISKCNGLYMDIPRSEAKSGANVHMWAKNNSKNQLFKLEKWEEKIQGEKTLDNGTYQIKSALNENFVFDIQGSSKENGGNLELWNNFQNANQRFVIKYLNNGTYSISPEHSKKYLDVKGSSKANGTNVAQWQYHGLENQQWIIKKAENGYYNIISKCNGLYIDIPRSDAKNGANVHLWTKNESKNQLFKFEKIVTISKGEKTIENGTYYIKSALNNKVLDVNRSSMEDNGNVGFWTKGETANQKFIVRYLGNGYYNIEAQHSGKNVKISDKANSKNVEQFYSNEFDSQQWVIKEDGEGYYNIISKINGNYLKQTITGNAEVAEKDNSNSQKFTFENIVQIKGKKTIEDGTYVIKSAVDNNYVFDVPRSSTSNNQIIKIWKNGSTANQKFKVQYIGEGYYTIEAQHSGKMLQVASDSKILYTNVEQNSKNESDKQKWIIKEAGNGYYYIISKYSELCIGIEQAQNGTILQMENVNGNDLQKFKFEAPIPMKGNKTVADGTYIITSALDNRMVLDIPHSSQKDGELLEIWTNGLTANQRFEVKYIGNGYYTIKAEHSGKAIEVASGNKKLNAHIQQNAVNSKDEQQWIIKDVGNGYYNIISKCSELCLDITNADTSNGTKLQTYSINYTNAQKFRFCNTNSIIDLDDNKYPGYIEKLEKLKISHPNWNFRFLYTGLTLDEAVKGEYSVHSRNLVPKSYSGEWVCSVCGTKLYDSGWYCASEKAIAYYMDSRNFLDETNIFQFLDLNTYDYDSVSLSGIQSKVNDTFLKNYANDINNACKNTNVNPYYIISRLLQEQGYSGTKIGTGMDGGDGKKYYNPFNIGASGNGYDAIYSNALSTAKSYGWDSMQKAIEGGIGFCKKNWLDNYQNTLYQNKFDIDSTNGTALYTHQYMQGLMGAESEAKILNSMYANTNKIDSKFTFIIPVYDKVSSISSKPSYSSETTPINVKVVASGGLNLRSEANANSDIIKLVSNGEIVLSVQRGINSNWQKIVLADGTIGYMQGSYLQQVNDVTNCNYSAYVKTSDGTGCYVRVGPSLSVDRITALSDGTEVTVINKNTYNNIDGYNWVRILMSDGRQAFMPSKYLKR